MIYKLAVVGGGPAGYSAALEAARLGLSVILFEKSELGGTCLNRGCVPTKFLAHTADIFFSAYNSSAYGIISEKPLLDFKAVFSKKEKIISELRDGLEQSMRQKGIEIVNGEATIKDSNHLVCSGQVYRAENIMIATGSIPAKPLADGAVTSDEMLEMDRCPASVKIIGGGASAMEFAHIFNHFGSDVTIAIRGERILRKWDKEIAIAITQNFKRRGIKILTNCDVNQLCEKNADITLSVTGRLPNINGVDRTLIDIDQSGGIVVDNVCRTKTPNIFAAGDVGAGSHMLAHTAMEQGKNIARVIAGQKISRPSAIVECLYISPEAAMVGDTEAAAQKMGIECVTAKRNMYSNARTLISGSGRSFIKIVAEKNSHRIVGAQLLCERASDIADELAMAINNELTAEDLVSCARPHPSYCEAITEVGEALLEKLYGV